MEEQPQRVKVATDYKIGRNINSIAFSLIALAVILGLALVFLFVKGRRKILPQVPKANTTSQLGPAPAAVGGGAENTVRVLDLSLNLAVPAMRARG